MAGRRTLRPVRQLSVGVQLPEVERDVRWSEIVSMARAAEETGFDSIWLGDHLLYRGDGHPERGPWDAWTTLAALAASIERVRLGPLVACAAFHPPGVLARMAASVDEVSGGRFVLGIGAGAVVTDDVPARAVVVGNPARVIRDVAEEELLS